MVQQAAVYLLSVGLVWNRLLSCRALAVILAVAALLRLLVLWCASLSLERTSIAMFGMGGLISACINPYRYVPVDPHLDRLRESTALPAHLRQHLHALTIYPPVAEGIFFVVTRISQSLVAMKAAMVVFEAITIAALLRSVKAAGLPSGHILVYAGTRCSFIWEFAGSGHIDAALIAFVVLALWVRRQGRAWFAGLALWGATWVLLYRLVPLLAVYRRWEWRLPIAFLAVQLILGYLPFIGAGWGVSGLLAGVCERGKGFTASGAGFFLWNVLQSFRPFTGLPTLFSPIAAASTIVQALAAAIAFAHYLAPTSSPAPRYWPAHSCFCNFAPLSLVFCLADLPYSVLPPLSSLLYELTIFILSLSLVGAGYNFTREGEVSMEVVIYVPLTVLWAHGLYRASSASYSPQSSHTSNTLGIRTATDPQAATPTMSRTSAARSPKSSQECVHLETTNRCNLLCTTCPRTFEALEPPGDMSWGCSYLPKSSTSSRRSPASRSRTGSAN